MKHLDFTVSIGKTLIDARVDYADNPKQIKETSLILHEHVLFEAYFIERGKLTLQCDKNILSLKEGDILLISPHTPHKILSLDDDLIRFNVQFMCKSITSKAAYSFFCPNDVIKNEIFSYLSIIRRYIEAKDNKADQFRMNHTFAVVLSYLVEPMLTPDVFVRAVGKNNRLQQCILIDQFFFERFAQSITIADLAETLNYSETQARRILMEYTGMSFADKLRQHRLQAAIQYLTTSPLSIDEIAERCGYQSRLGFESMFKKLMGISPHKYRIDINQGRQ